MSDPDNFDDEELVSSNPNQRNWRGIMIALLVIVAVLALIVTSVVLLTPPDEGPRVRGRRFRLGDILGPELAALRFNGSWVSGEELLFRDQWGGISLLNAANLTTRTIMSNTTFKHWNPARFTMSPDHKYILMTHNVQKLFRYSYLAQYTVYDIATMDTFALSPGADADDGGAQPFLLLASWVPRGLGVVMVHNYDIYYRPDPAARGPAYRVTDTGVPGVVFNGVPDWLYEEEVLGSNSALWTSDDGHQLLYARFNDSRVEEQRFPWFGVAREDGRLYPEIRSLRYPKPGTPNPSVSLWVADLADPKNINTRDVKPPVAFKHLQDVYVTAATWVSETSVAVVWLNRPQNLSLITVCKGPMWYCMETQRVSGEGRGWVDAGVAPLFARDGGSYVTLAPVRDGAAGYFRHVVHVNVQRRRLLPLTRGRGDVARLLAWDHAEQLVYYLGAPEGRPGQLHLYRARAVPPSGDDAPPAPLCLTCQPADPFDNGPYSAFYAAMERGRSGGGSGAGSGGGEPDAVVEEPRPDTGDWDDEYAAGEAPSTDTPPFPKKRKGPYRWDVMGLLLRPCLYHNAVFSPGLTYLVLECLGPGVPTVQLLATRTGGAGAAAAAAAAGAPGPTPGRPRLLATLQNNSALVERASKMALPQVKTFPVQISGGYHAQVRLHLPPGLREDEITRYPLVVQVYGGPGTQLVTERWKLDWSTYLAGSRDFIVAQIDGRGSGGQGYQLLHEVYMRLGSVEVADQLEVPARLAALRGPAARGGVGMELRGLRGRHGAGAGAGRVPLRHLRRARHHVAPLRLGVHGAVHGAAQPDGQLQGLRGGGREPARGAAARQDVLPGARHRGRQRALPAEHGAGAGAGQQGRALPPAGVPRREPRAERRQASPLPLHGELPGRLLPQAGAAGPEGGTAQRGRRGRIRGRLSAQRTDGARRPRGAALVSRATPTAAAVAGASTHARCRRRRWRRRVPPRTRTVDGSDCACAFWAAGSAHARCGRRRGLHLRELAKRLLLFMIVCPRWKKLTRTPPPRFPPTGSRQLRAGCHE